jgi:DNA-binding NtrC family response regulator
VPRELNPEHVGEALEALGIGRAARAVLIIESDPDQQQRLARLLTLGGHRVIGTSTVDGGRTLLKEFPVDLVLIAEELTVPNPMAVIADMVGVRPEARFVVLTEPEEPVSGVRPARFEALEYLERPTEPEAFRALLTA